MLRVLTSSRAVTATTATATAAARILLRWTSTSKPAKLAVPVDLIRNCGIMAHIDAGKTTTTERMLHYAGETRAIGNVDDGNTVTDYLIQERERGITIVSAAVTFGWKGHRINLIDTPGHVDFTVEVERAVRVMDGMVAVLDGVSGVEAQTRTVWAQAVRYGVPRIVFVNKMDREGANFVRCVKSLRETFQGTFTPIQMPVGGDVGVFKAIVDLVTNEVLTWTNVEGTEFTRTPLAESSLAASIVADAQAARAYLIDSLTMVDDVFLEAMLELEDDGSASFNAQVGEAVARSTKQGLMHPVLCGSSFRNRGVQPLLDAMVAYLPDPTERPPVAGFYLDSDTTDKRKVSYTKKAKTKNNLLEPIDSTEFAIVAPTVAPPDAKRLHIAKSVRSGDLCMLAYKVSHSNRRAAMVHFRVYQGAVRAHEQLKNNTRGGAIERVGRLLQLFGGEYQEVDVVEAGNIGVAMGLHATYTGDTLTQAIPRPREMAHAVLEGIVTPAPVFFCTIEADGAASQSVLDDAVRSLLREDPSLRAKVDPDSGQTVLSGMGELHLEIVRDRLKREFAVEAFFGDVQVSYRETPTKPVQVKHNFNRTVGGRAVDLAATIHVEPLDIENQSIVYDAFELQQKKKANQQPPAAAGGAAAPVAAAPAVAPTEKSNEITTSNNNNNSSSNSETSEPVPSDADAVARDAAIEAMKNACELGVVTGFPLCAARVRLEALHVGVDVPPTAVEACVLEAVSVALKRSQLARLEPYMALEITCDDEHVGHVLSDVTTHRSGTIHSVDLAVGGTSNITTHCIRAQVPLSTMVGYSKFLRTMTGGRGSFTMEFQRYDKALVSPSHLNNGY